MLLKLRLMLRYFRHPRWPFMLKRTHEYREWNWKTEKAHLSSRITELEAIKAELDVVLPKLVRLSCQRDVVRHNYRVCLDLDPILIRDAFQWGNSRGMIDAFAERVGVMVRRELFSVNMHRFKDFEQP